MDKARRGLQTLAGPDSTRGGWGRILPLPGNGNNALRSQCEFKVETGVRRYCKGAGGAHERERECAKVSRHYLSWETKELLKTYCVSNAFTYMISF